MTQSYAQLQKKISALQSEALKRRTAEVKAVIGRMKDAIAVYDITAGDLFGAAGTKRGIKSRKARTPYRAGIKYADGSGNTWVGMGKRPQWLRDALDAGKSLQDFAVVGSAKPKGNGASASGKKTVTGKKRKGAGKIKYRNGAGHSWTGFGPQPGWLKEAIAAGKTLEDFAV